MDSEDHSSSDTILIATDVKFKNAPLQDEKQMEMERNKRRREMKEEEDEKYNSEMYAQRYKRLMHLLNKSKFYSSYLVDKIGKSMQETKIVRKREKSTVNNENVPSQKKRTRRNLDNYDISKYIPVDMKQKMQNKRKLNLDIEDKENYIVEMKKNNKTILPKYFNGDLYDYQKDGLQWLKLLYENSLNGILADEMGLGKTIQVIALMCHLIENRQTGPYLIIVPLSTVPNWLMEFERFAPNIPVVLFHGPENERIETYTKIRKKYRITNDYKTQPIVITTYEIVLQDINFFRSETWRYVVIDEAHRIKNHNCRLIKMLRTMKSMNKLLLTGTPLQNNLSELWSLLNFLLPEIFDDLAVFKSWLDAKELCHEEGTKKFLKQEVEEHVLQSLREILKPFMLRREKSDVCLNLPLKKELVVYAPLTELQHDLYKAVLNRDIQTLSKINEPSLIIPTIDGKRPKRQCVLRSQYGYSKSNSENQITSTSTEEKTYNNENNTEKEVGPINKQLSMWKQYTNVTERNQDFLLSIHLQNRLVMYKKIVNHPYLVHCPLDHVGLPKVDDDLINSSGKLLVLDAMLGKLKAQGHKILLFSTMTQILDMIEDYLSLRDYDYVRLDGLTKISSRKKNIENFNNDPNIFLFLISTRAGGLGLNLVGADTVIIYDSDWNPQVDIQAMARCHRIGQNKPVVVYRLCTKGTIDEAIIQRGQAKRILEKMIISKEFSCLSKDNVLMLQQLLESKEYKIVTSKNDVFTEAELNKLLDRNDMFNNSQ